MLPQIYYALQVYSVLQALKLPHHLLTYPSRLGLWSYKRKQLSNNEKLVYKLNINIVQYILIFYASSKLFHTGTMEKAKWME